MKKLYAASATVPICASLSGMIGDKDVVIFSLISVL